MQALEESLPTWAEGVDVAQGRGRFVSRTGFLFLSSLCHVSDTCLCADGGRRDPRSRAWTREAGRSECARRWVSLVQCQPCSVSSSLAVSVRVLIAGCTSRIQRVALEVNRISVRLGRGYCLSIYMPRSVARTNTRGLIVTAVLALHVGQHARDDGA